MKLRGRWYGVDLSGSSIRRVADAMERAQYSRRTPAGFKLEEARRSHLAGQFIERIEWDEVLTDPAVGDVPVHRVDVRQVRFRLAGSSPELELINPPRSLGTFFENLEQCIGGTLALHTPEVQPVAWLSSLEGLIGRTKVVALSLTGITVSASASASVHLDGTEDVRRHISKFGSGRGVKLDRLTVELPSPYFGRCELQGSGRMELNCEHAEALDLVRTALQSALSSTRTTGAARDQL